jgi:hypothetical protein
METITFEEWFSKVFLKHAKSVEGAKILIFDGHISHISLQVIDEVRNNNIHIILLPAHTTHFLQPEMYNRDYFNRFRLRLTIKINQS